ncbi:MAG: nucleotidyltransferase domain-containing protein [Clostridia bacterium]|nr:nucleotidyltransferase domain-containing protein [Clostridia bacterium]
MCNKSQLDEIIHRIVDFSKETFGEKFKNVILYGSYARGDYDAESDIDIMIMVDMSREELAKYRKIMNNFCADLDLQYNVLLALKLQSQPFFNEWIDALPFYRNVAKDGVLYA